MSSIFAIVCSATPTFHNTKFYSTKELAQKQLKKLADERRYKLGIHCFEETEDKFTYLLGWEERRVSYSILEIEVLDK